MFEAKKIEEPKDTSAAAEFMVSLQRQFHVKKKEDEKAWFDDMVKELKWYPAEVLQQAAKNIIRRRRNEYFPVLSECLAACEDAKQWLDAASPKMRFGGIHDASPGSSDRQRLADELVMGELGRQASNEGWILGLWCFVRDRGKMPKPYQITRLKNRARGFDMALEDCRRGGWSHAAPLKELGLSMLSKRQALADMVLHGVTK